MGYRNDILEKLLRGKNIFRIIMGTITTWLLMIALQADESTAVVIVMDVVIFAVLLLMSYVFASVVAEEIINRRRTNFRRIFEILREVSPVIFATIPPFLIFIIASLGIITEKTGYTLSDISLWLILFIMGFLSGKSIGSISLALVHGILAASLGVGLVILRSMVI